MLLKLYHIYLIIYFYKFLCPKKFFFNFKQIKYFFYLYSQLVSLKVSQAIKPGFKPIFSWKMHIIFTLNTIPYCICIHRSIHFYKCKYNSWCIRWALKVGFYWFFVPWMHYLFLVVWACGGGERWGNHFTCYQRYWKFSWAAVQWSSR